MTRTHWLLIAVALLTANFAYHWWRDRGLITIHCENWPPSKVVREIERQGGVTVKSNLPEDLKVQMDVTKVSVGEALETLATVTESRWRLTYIFAPALPEAHAALTSYVSGQRPDGWKKLHIPVFNSVADESDTAPDPRIDPWLVKPVERPEFQAYVAQAAQSVNAEFAYPENWNPPVKKAPSAGPISHAAPALASAAGGRVLEVFTVEKRSRDVAGDRGRDRGGPPDGDFLERVGFRGDGDRDKMRDAFAARQQAEIEKLPADKRAEAQADFDARRKFYESLRDLPPEERRAKMEERMNDPATQDKIENKMSQQSARMSPQQRVEKAKGYISRKESVRGQAAAR